VRRVRLTGGRRHHQRSEYPSTSTSTFTGRSCTCSPLFFFFLLTAAKEPERLSTATQPSALCSGTPRLALPPECDLPMETCSSNQRHTFPGLVHTNIPPALSLTPHSLTNLLPRWNSHSHALSPHYSRSHSTPQLLQKSPPRSIPHLVPPPQPRRRRLPSSPPHISITSASLSLSLSLCALRLMRLSSSSPSNPRPRPPESCLQPPAPIRCPRGFSQKTSPALALTLTVVVALFQPPRRVSSPPSAAGRMQSPSERQPSQSAVAVRPSYRAYPERPSCR
jgi:hypothetical protein